ncbi:MAG TPA: AraC family transcriptional regulator [Gemmatimonadales bacterium]|nr:AraC family transcriptional regulator [Gemmatimonadales bacterium]
MPCFDARLARAKDRIPLVRTRSYRVAVTTCRSSLLFEGALVTVRDVRCTAHVASAGAEEHASGHHLVFTRRGVFVKHTGRAARVEEVAEPVRVLLFNRGEPYRVSHPAAGGDACTVLAFDGATAADVAEQLGERRTSPAAPFGFGSAPLTPAEVYGCQRLRAAVADSPLAIEEEGLRLLAAVVAAGRCARGLHPPPHSAGMRRAHARLADEVRLALATAPGRAHTLASLARQVGRSPWQLARIFRQETGTSIHQYLLRLRIGLALERLAQGETHLSTLALDLGFANHGHFTTAFRRLVGAPPAMARRHLARPARI